MNGQQQAARRERIREERQRRLKRGVGINLASRLPFFPPIFQRCFIAVMSIRDDTRSLCHKVPQLGNPFGVRQTREFVLHPRAVLGGPQQFPTRPEGRGQDRRHFVLAVLIQHEHARKIRLRGSQKTQAVGFGASQSAFVRQDHALLVLGQRQLAKKSNSLKTGSVRRGESLLHHVIGRLFVLQEDTLLQPSRQRLRNLRVIRPRFIPHIACQFEANRIVGIPVEKRTTFIRRHHIVRRHHHLGEINSVEGVVNGAKRSNNGHGLSSFSKVNGSDPGRGLQLIEAPSICRPH